MIFVIDIDDTISETDKYSEYYISKFIKENNLPYKQIKKVTRFAEAKFDWSVEVANKWYKEYGDQMMLEFPCKENSVEVINNLHNLGHKIIIATARANDWHKEPERITKEWLEKNNIKYDKLYVGRIDKEQICIEEKADYFIDDDVKLCERVLNDSINTTPIIMLTEYNKTLDISSKIIKINNLNELEKIFTNM